MFWKGPNNEIRNLAYAEILYAVLESRIPARYIKNIFKAV